MIVVLGLFLGGHNGGHGNALADCVKNESVGPCGTNLTGTPVVCGPGQPTCSVGETVTFGQLFNCVGSGNNGLTQCEAAKCQKTVVIRDCMAGMCHIVSSTPSDVMDMSVAGGGACNIPAPGPVNDPIELDPPEFRPAPLP
jgi:hypothetical protein